MRIYFNILFRNLVYIMKNYLVFAVFLVQKQNPLREPLLFSLEDTKSRIMCKRAELIFFSSPE